MGAASSRTTERTSLPRLSVRDTGGVLADVVMPLFARGVIIRRPRVVGLLDRMDADARAVRRLRDLRSRYGDGPVLLGLPGREVAVVLSAEDVHRVLSQSPDTFTPANAEKRAALGHFQPHGVLISDLRSRPDRRRFNEEVLDSGQPVHRLGEAIVAKVAEEADELLERARRSGGLGWDDFAEGWWRAVRRVVLGDSARNDPLVTDLLARLRADANWAFLKPKRRGLRDRFLSELERHLARAEPGSLASLVASVKAGPETYPVEQVPQWLFAFDAAGMASFRALALLDGYPDQQARARAELAGRDLSQPHDLSFLRACLLESVRLWPTTPAILRDTTEETTWSSGELPRGAAVVIFAPFFHRDERQTARADRFASDLWLDGRAQDDLPLIPFSEGPGECAGRNLVLLTTSALLAKLVAGGRFCQAQPRPLSGAEPLPKTLSPFRLRFELRDAA